MIVAQSSIELEVKVDQTTTTFFTLETAEEIMLSFLLLDAGTGFRPFVPLFLKVDGIERVVPMTLEPGVHTLELLGEPFSGTGLLLVGYGLYAVKGVTIGRTDAVASAQLATIPQYYEGDGPPDGNPIVNGAINGARYKDRLNKIRYELSEGTWLQLAS